MMTIMTMMMIMMTMLYREHSDGVSAFQSSPRAQANLPEACHTASYKVKIVMAMVISSYDGDDTYIAVA